MHQQVPVGSQLNSVPQAAHTSCRFALSKQFVTFGTKIAASFSFGVHLSAKYSPVSFSAPPCG
jgi:hypothetical protein